jgi:hypothetical protein
MDPLQHVHRHLSVTIFLLISALLNICNVTTKESYKWMFMTYYEQYSSEQSDRIALEQMMKDCQRVAPVVLNVQQQVESETLWNKVKKFFSIDNIRGSYSDNGL